MTELLAAAQRGELAGLLRREGLAVRRGVRVAVQGETRRLQRDLREAVARAFAGSRGARKAAGAIRAKLYDDRDGAAGLVYSRFGRMEGGRFIDYLLPFTTGATLRPRRSRWLYISLEKGAKARRRRRLAVAADPRLAFVPARGGNKVWVVRRSPRGRRTTLVAVLVKRVSLRKRLDVGAPVAGLRRRLPESLLRAMEEQA